MDERIILDDQPREPSGSPLGMLAALGIIAMAIAVIALRPADVNPNSLGATPPTTLFVPPEATTTTTVAAALNRQVPGLRGALHFEVVSDEGRQLWVWNATEPGPSVVSVPGQIDVSANRRNAASISVNRAGEDVLWLGPKLSIEPAEIFDDLIGVAFHRTMTASLAIATQEGNDTVLTAASFNGASLDMLQSQTLTGRWEPIYWDETGLGLNDRDTSRSIVLSGIGDGQVLHRFEGLLQTTTGRPVVYECHNRPCTNATVSWIDLDGEVQPSPALATLFPDAQGRRFAVMRRVPFVHTTEILDSAGRLIMEVPYAGWTGSWSGDGRFFIFPRTEFQFDDEPALVFLDLESQTHHVMRPPVLEDWVITRIWYGP